MFANIKRFFNLKEYVFQLFDDYTKVASEVRYKAFKEEVIKISAPKQMLQRLPIAPEQVKTGNTSASLLNKIRQFIYSFY